MAAKAAKDFIGKLTYAETDYFHRVTSNIPLLRVEPRKKSVGGSSLLAGGAAVDAMRWFMQGRGGQRLCPRAAKMRTDLEFDGTIAIILKFQTARWPRSAPAYDFIQPLCVQPEPVRRQRAPLWERQAVVPGHDSRAAGLHAAARADPPNSGDVEGTIPSPKRWSISWTASSTTGRPTVPQRRGEDSGRSFCSRPEAPPPAKGEVRCRWRADAVKGAARGSLRRSFIMSKTPCFLRENTAFFEAERSVLPCAAFRTAWPPAANGGILPGYDGSARRKTR